jgi:hypothetical protein
VGLFKTLGRLAGGIVRTGLSVVTHGVSDKVLGALKSRGDSKKVAGLPEEMYNAQQQALAAKLAPLGPRVKRTEQVLTQATVRMEQARPRKPTSKRMPGYKRSYDPTVGESERPEPRSAPRMRKRPAKPRSLPKGALDLAAIASMWRAQGKPGTWRDFIKANSHIRKG